MFIKVRVGKDEYHFASDETPVLIVLNKQELEFFQKVFSHPQPPKRIIFCDEKKLPPRNAEKWMQERP